MRAILQRALRDSGMARRLPRRIGAQTWASAVGEQIAARAQPTALFAGTLHVLVQDHRWRDQLDAARHFLLERLNRALGAGTVRELQFGLAHTGALDAARKAAGIGVPEAPTPSLEPERILGQSRLPGPLREAVLRAAEASARRAARK